LKWSSGSLPLMVSLCWVGGPVPNLVNTLDLSKNSSDSFVNAEDIKEVYEV